MRTTRAALTALAAAIGLAFAVPALAGTGTMTKDDFKASKKVIEADYTVAKAGCDSLRANAKDICMAEAKGRENIALAELDATNQPGVKANYNVRIAKAQAQHSIAKEKCDDKAGNVKDVCVKEADAVNAAARADAKTQMTTVDANKAASQDAGKARAKADEQISEARIAAAADKRAAEYTLAKEKCDALAGNAKDACMNDAKARYGKL